MAGEGSTFHLVVRMPVAAADARDASARPPRVEADLSGRRVLIVDDNATNRRILVAQTASGAWSRARRAPRSEALGWLKDGERFDIVLSICSCRRWTGWSSRRAHRRPMERPSARPPIVILSSVGRARS